MPRKEDCNMLKTLFLIFAVGFIALYLGGEVLGMLFGVIGTVFGALVGFLGAIIGLVVGIIGILFAVFGLFLPILILGLIVVGIVKLVSLA